MKKIPIPDSFNFCDPADWKEPKKKCMKLQPQTKWFLIGGLFAIVVSLFFDKIVFKQKVKPPIHDTIYLPEATKTILEKSDSLCLVFGVPPNLVREIGNNETKWNGKCSPDGLTCGDIQVSGAIYKHYEKKLGLKGLRTRENYLVAGIAHLRHCYDVSGSWMKARYIYARGKYKPEWQWSKLERHFMQKINWENYD